MKKIDIACIVDDDPIFVFGAKRIMELSNFCKGFMVFNNGRDALDSLSPLVISGENIPDVILLDLNMPIMDGWQFLDEFIKIKTNKKIVIYIVSSSIDPADTEKAKQYQNVSNFIVKPITVDNLKAILKEITEDNT
ncbi:response regulator [Patiriisocius hiemis]|uniref:Response regulator n=1 Tax=Patiriisocius hiemis TaxID=3075604 RepID=A0ABU2YAZ3_9FLAO|nr:response regulator [Constantimarinum sp. W242]MDT0555365.1 response regulator [Constantimarinum sp. W242]